MIPCELSGCDQHIYHYINCAVWTCTEKTTPRPPVTTTSKPGKPGSCKSGVCISSVTVNVLFGLAFLGVATHFGRKAWLKRSQSNNYASYESAPLLPSAPPSAAPVDNSGFQEVPLIPRADVSPAANQVPLRSLAAFKKFWSRPSSATAEAETSL